MVLIFHKTEQCNGGCSIAADYDLELFKSITSGNISTVYTLLKLYNGDRYLNFTANRFRAFVCISGIEFYIINIQ